MPGNSGYGYFDPWKFHPWILGWVFLAHFFNFLIPAYFRGCVYSKSWPQDKKVSICFTLVCAGSDLVFLGYQTIWGPLNGVIWVWNWKSVIKMTYCEHFLFYEKYFLFIIFWTLFSKNWPFFGQFSLKFVLGATIKNQLQILSKNLSEIDFWTFFENTFL